VNGSLTKRQHVTILPIPPNKQNPFISICDLIPEKYRGDFHGFDPSKVAQLDMEEYRDLLLEGKWDLAHQRAMEHIRPKQPSNPEWIFA